MGHPYNMLKIQWLKVMMCLEIEVEGAKQVRKNFLTHYLSFLPPSLDHLKNVLLVAVQKQMKRFKVG